MTQICFETTKDTTDITIMGHCNAGKINGSDLCCCAVSMLVFTLMDSLKKLKLDGFTSGYGGGWCHVRFDNCSKNLADANTVIQTVLNGFHLLKGRFPSNIDINICSHTNERSENNGSKNKINKNGF